MSSISRRLSMARADEGCPARPDRRECQTCSAADASDGDGGDLSITSDDHYARAPGLSLFVARSGDGSAQPCLVCGHHVSAIAEGLCLLLGMMDWFSRFGFAWEVSNSLDGFFCEALDRARATYANDLQHRSGSQFIAHPFTALGTAGVQISIDGPFVHSTTSLLNGCGAA